MTQNSSNDNAPDAAFDFRIPFGKYRGRSIAEIARDDAEYLRWLEKYTLWGFEGRREIDSALAKAAAENISEEGSK